MLALPLRYYDEAGRILPPKALYMLQLWLLQSILIFLGAAIIRNNGAEILSLWYPSKTKLYLAMAASFPAFLSFLIVSYRNKMWERGVFWVFYFIKPCLYLSLGLQTMLLLNTIVELQFHFSYTLGLTALMNMTAVLYVYKSRHLEVMCTDWRLRVSN